MSPFRDNNNEKRTLNFTSNQITQAEKENANHKSFTNNAFAESNNLFASPINKKDPFTVGNLNDTNPYNLVNAPSS